MTISIGDVIRLDDLSQLLPDKELEDNKVFHGKYVVTDLTLIMNNLEQCYDGCKLYTVFLENTKNPSIKLSVKYIKTNLPVLNKIDVVGKAEQKWILN